MNVIHRTSCHHNLVLEHLFFWQDKWNDDNRARTAYLCGWVGGGDFMLIVLVSLTFELTDLALLGSFCKLSFLKSNNCSLFENGFKKFPPVAG